MVCLYNVKCLELSSDIISAAISSSAHSITGEVSCGTQYHFHMETQVLVYTK